MVGSRQANLSRKLLSEFIKSPETIKAFENLSLNSDDLATAITKIQNAAVLVLSLTDAFTNERLVTTDGEVDLVDGGPGGSLTFGLSETGVEPGTYGDASHVVQFTVSEKGRISFASSTELNSDNVVEGLVNLYFTDARSRNALSSGTGMDYNPTTGAISVGAVLAAYAGGDTPSPFFLGIVDAADQAAFRTAIGAGTGAGSVTSVDVSGGSTGLTFSGGPVFTTGTITMAGTLSIANGGTGATSAAGALTNLGGVSTARSISTGTGLVGGGNLTADRTLSLATSGVTAGSYGSATKIPTITLDVYGRATIASENTIPVLDAGTYTPTLTNVANLDASTSYSCQYLRVGNVVCVSGKLDVDPTAASTLTQLGISLPIASNLANNNECAGTGTAHLVAGQNMAVRGDVANDRAELVFVAQSTANQAVFFSFEYRII